MLNQELFSLLGPFLIPCTFGGQECESRTEKEVDSCSVFDGDSDVKSYSLEYSGIDGSVNREKHRVDIQQS